MAYRDLLPETSTVTTALRNEGLTPEQQQNVLDAVSQLLQEHADYYQYEYDRIGEKDDRGAGSALQEMGDSFRSEARYATANDGK